MGTVKNNLLKRKVSLLFFSLVILYGCNGSFRVLDVKTKAPSWVNPPDYTYKVVLNISFNHSVNPNTFSAPGTVKLDLKGTNDGRTVSNVAGTFQFSADKKTVVFISNERMSKIINPQAGENIEYTVIISGNSVGGGVITDSDGITLDGNNDGAPGGDYKLVFEVVG